MSLPSSSSSSSLGPFQFAARVAARLANKKIARGSFVEPRAATTRFQLSCFRSHARRRTTCNYCVIIDVSPSVVLHNSLHCPRGWNFPSRSWSSSGRAAATCLSLRSSRCWRRRRPPCEICSAQTRTNLHEIHLLPGRFVIDCFRPASAANANERHSPKVRLRLGA